MTSEGFAEKTLTLDGTTKNKMFKMCPQICREKCNLITCDDFSNKNKKLFSASVLDVQTFLNSWLAEP